MIEYFALVRPPVESTGPIDPKAIESIDFVMEHDGLPSSDHLKTICYVSALAVGSVLMRNGRPVEASEASFEGEVVVESATSESLTILKVTSKAMYLLVRDVLTGDLLRAQYGQNGLMLSVPPIFSSTA